MLLQALLALLSFQSINALYEEQVRVFDWYQQYVGPVSFISIDQTSRAEKAVIVASESGVLAAINSKTGEITWRQEFEPGQNGIIDHVLLSRLGALVTVSHEGQLLRSWDISSGALKWETTSGLPAVPGNKVYPVDETWRPGGVLATLTGKNGGTLVLVASNSVIAFSTRTGQVKWEATLEGSEGERVVCGLYSDGRTVYAVSVVDSSIVMVTQFNSSNGASLGEQQLPAPWFSMESDSCVITQSHVVCLKSSRLDLYHASLSTGTAFTPTMLSSLGVQRSTNDSLVKLFSTSGLWLELGNSRWELVISDDSVSIATILNNGFPLDDSFEDHVTNAVLKYTNEGVLLEIGDEGGVAYQPTGSRGTPVRAAVHFITSKDSSVKSYLVVMTMEDDSLILFNKEGIVWERQEALGVVSAVEMMDLPAGESDLIETFVELTMTESNPFKIAYQRLKLQILLAKEFFTSLQQEGVASLVQMDSAELIRDEFSTRKLIIAATANGKVFGLDSRNGGIVWQFYLPWLRPFDNGHLELHLLRTTSHPPHPPLAVVVGKATGAVCAGGSVLYDFNPLTGQPLSNEPTCLPVLLQTLLLPTLDHAHSKILLMLTTEFKVVAFPSSHDLSALLSSHHQALFISTADTATGVVNGYQIMFDQLLPFSTNQIWSLNFPLDSEKLITVASKSPNEHVSSQGRVRTDRSVQFKYLNPNLVAMVTEAIEYSKPFISVYLVDRVTGGVVHHTTHKQAAGPVRIVHSENWIVYQFFNTKQRRHELVVLELYESNDNQTHTVWSSLTPPPIPDVVSQSYVFPSTLHTLTTTRTLRGITHKSILLGLHSGHIVALPKGLLDPRRTIETTDEMKEEGLPPYLPQLGLSPATFINYNNTVSRIHTIFTAPSGLESTSLVLACGLDLYFTRVTPSKQYDLLPDDFDFTFVLGVVSAMVLGTLILSKLAARKTLRSLWK